MEYQIVISGTIGSWWSSCSADYVRYVLNNNKNKEVHVGFCSLGGMVKDGLEMNQAFRDHGNVHAHAFGMNASISTVAMLGCKTIDMVKGSFFLIHNTSTYVGIDDQANKDQIDAYIKSLKDQKENLKTFDDVLASMYAEKTGKSIEECKVQMDKGNWLNADQTLAFGLVDSIRNDSQAEAETDKFNNQFTNLYSTTFKDSGIPPLPVMSHGDNRLSYVIDQEGNPTQNFLQKTWQGLKSLVHNQHDNTKLKNMTKVFTSVMNLLSRKDGFTTDEKGNISLSNDQMKQIDDTLHANSEAMTKAAEAIKKLKDDLEKTKADLKDRDAQITVLKGSAGDDTHNNPPEVPANVTAQELFNLVSQV
ncbi:MAG: Clp protease ClpP [Prevotella sp.]|jgi:ATP-dependent protease ClpP protease subunit|nr:Clp protease ClpP [Prevotella sp.]